jgi:hypothetical protein
MPDDAALIGVDALLPLLDANILMHTRELQPLVLVSKLGVFANFFQSRFQGLCADLLLVAHPWDARWFGGVVAVEHRYIDAIVQGAIDDGLSTSGGRTVL